MEISRRGLAMAILITCATVVAAVPDGPSNDPRESARELSNTTSSPQTSPLINSPRTGEQKTRSIRKYLEEHGIGMQDIPKALIVYESMSMTLLFTLLVTTYTVQPFHGALEKMAAWQTPPIQTMIEHARAASETRFGWLSRHFHLDAMRLAESYAQCAVLRLFLKPLLVPLKLYLTWRLVAKQSR